jgi:hypothetical protein
MSDALIGVASIDAELRTEFRSAAREIIGSNGMSAMAETTEAVFNA